MKKVALPAATRVHDANNSWPRHEVYMQLAELYYNGLRLASRRVHCLRFVALGGGGGRGSTTRLPFTSRPTTPLPRKPPRVPRVSSALHVMREM